jgi:hypothetical protein
MAMNTMRSPVTVMGVMGSVLGGRMRPARETCTMYAVELTRSARMASTQMTIITIFAVLPGRRGAAGSGSLNPA